MAAVIHLLPDPFAKKEAEIKKDTVTATTNKYESVRRPTRGYQTKKDTYALLEVKTRTGQNLLMIDSGGPIDSGNISYGPRNSNFLIQSIDEQRAEKVQMVETFGPLYLFWFGERPTMLSASGVLLNSSDFNWKNEFLANYDMYLRGTQCAQNKTIIHFSYDDVIRTGFIQSCSVSQGSDLNELVNFNFQMIVSSSIDTSIIGYNQLPVEDLAPDTTAAVLDLSMDTGTGMSNTSADKLLNQISKGVNMYNKYKAQASNFISLAERYLTGNVLQIPEDLTGQALFDTTTGPVKYTYNSPKGPIIIPTVEAKIRENEEEYIARSASSNYNKIAIYQNANTRNILKGKELELKINKQLATLGIKRKVPKIVSLATKGAFAAINVGLQHAIPKAGL